MGAVSPGDDYCVVGSDNVGGGRLATSRMLSLGRRKIAFLGDTDLPEMRQRFEGYCEALESHRIAVDDDLVIHTPFDIEKTREVSLPFVKLFPRFDGIFACSDMIAIAAIANLRQAGIKVPEDVSAVGFDDIPSSAHVSPPITTIHQRIHRSGQVMVEKLIAMLEGDAPDPVIMETELVVRQSCGAHLST